jgi:outer membrane cobalamin receptor
MRFKATNDLAFGLQGQWINNLFSIENPYSYGPVNYVRLHPYTLLNLNLNWDINDNFTLSAKINNLMDREYETMYLFPMPGRHFTVGINAKY